MRNAILLGIGIGAAASVPLIYRTNPGTFEALVRSNVAREADNTPSQTAAAPPERLVAKAELPQLSGRKVQIEADANGHFTSDFKVNGRRVTALIDTGATAVAINLSTARRLGISIAMSDLKETVRTANGDARATLIRLDRIEIGRIVVDDVEAVVLDDNALSSTLIGMTFLKRLSKYEAGGGRITLVQ